MSRSLVLTVAAVAMGAPRSSAAPETRSLVTFRGQVVDAETRRPIPSRVYIQRPDGSWYFRRTETAKRRAVIHLREKKDEPSASEMHTTLSAHPFVVDLPAGTYSVTVERGKEYLPATRQVVIGKAPVREVFELRRWID